MGKSLPISPWDNTAPKPPLLASVVEMNFFFSLKLGYCKIGSVTNFDSKALLPFILVGWGVAQIRRDEVLASMGILCESTPAPALHQCVQRNKFH